MTEDKPVGGFFRVQQDGQGTFTLQQSHDKISWVTIQEELNLQQVMELQSRITNSNILNHLNFLSILKNL